jgi:hypothetical protein
MATRTSVPRKREPALPFATRIEIVVMVQHPERVYRLDFGMRTLLPVDPPKVDAFIFEGMVQLFEIGLEELLVGAFEWDGLR